MQKKNKKIKFHVNFCIVLQDINNLALKDEVCCLGKVFDSGFNTSKNALKGGVLNPSHTIKWRFVSSPLIQTSFFPTEINFHKRATQVSTSGNPEDSQA